MRQSKKMTFVVIAVVVTIPLLVGCTFLLTPPGGPSSQESLVSWWRGNRTATDSADGNNGTLRNGTTFSSGKVDQAFSFDGVDDFVEVPPAANLYPSGSFTLCAWIKTPSVNRQQIAGIYEGGNYSFSNVSNSLFALLTDDGKLFGVVRDTDKGGPERAPIWGGEHIHGSIYVADGAFHHVALVRNIENNLLLLFVDGVLDTSAPLNNGAKDELRDDDNQPDPFLIGAAKESGNRYVTVTGEKWFFQGSIDDVRFYNRALTASEITTLQATP